MALNEEYLQIGSDIIGMAFEVRNNSGSGLLESYYEKALASELRLKGYNVKRQALVPCLYKGREIDDAYRADLVVDDRVVVEVKSVRVMGSLECHQIMTYMELMSFKLGYLINFSAQDFKIGHAKSEYPFSKGIYRFVNRI